MKQLFIIEYENAHWCGGQLNCLAWAHSPEGAIDAASEFMEETQRELFSDHYDEEGRYDGEPTVTVIGVMLMAGSEFEKYYNDASQAEFYPVVN
jgi:hypothetical protein